jgi:hypothetical protein
VTVLELAPLLFLGWVAAALSLQWASVPERFPVHFTLLGRPDRFAERSAASAFAILAAGLLSVLALVALRRLLLTRGGRDERRATPGAALGAAYAVAALLGAAAAQPLLGAPGPWGVAVGAGMSFLSVPLFFTVASARAKWPSAPPRLREPSREEGASGRRRLWALVVACAALGAGLVLARIR